MYNILKILYIFSWSEKQKEIDNVSRFTYVLLL